MWKRRCLTSLFLCAALMLSACNSTDPFEMSSLQSSSSSSYSYSSSGSSPSGSSSQSSSDSSSSGNGGSSSGGKISQTQQSSSGSSGAGGGQQAASNGNSGGAQQPSSSNNGGGGNSGFTWDKGGNYTGGINIPTCSAPGTQVKTGSQGSAIDYSNAAQGYVMVKKGNNTKTKVRVQGPNGGTYQRYVLPSADTYYPLPLQMGSGFYTVTVLINTSGNSYATAAKVTFEASLSSSTACYLLPNIYANYTASSSAVRKSFGLCMNAKSDLDMVKSIYNYIITTIKYDSAKASSVTSAYVPNPDSTLASGKGICFDYAGLMATMLRAQGIPTKVVIGTTRGQAHAWNEVYVRGVGWISIGIQSNGGWKRLDATMGVNNNYSYTENSGNYVTQEYY